MAITEFLSRFPGLLNRGPGGPASLGHVPHSIIFSPTATAQSGAWGPLSAGCWFSLPHLTSNWLTSCLHLGYIIIWRLLFFLRASQFLTQFSPSTVKVISWYSSTWCTYYLHRCISYFDILAGVNMLHFFKTQCNDAREWTNSWERLRMDYFRLLPTESLTASILSWNLAVNFTPDLRIFAF